VSATLVIIAARLNLNQVDEDAIYYIRIAQYYLTGQTALMISGYWGPMLSWLIAPWLLLFHDPLSAARAAMAVSAMVFLFGCVSVLRAAQLPEAAVVTGTWIIALIGLAWSVAGIIPDLLLTGLLALGASRLLSDKWMVDPMTAFGAGLVLGAAYLTKAVALPGSLLMVAGFACANVVVHRTNIRQALRIAAITIGGVLVLAGPWIGILSIKYGRPVFSTTGRIAHAIVGPPDMDRYHPEVRTFHKPGAGRIGAGEDLTDMPYNYWSPFESVSYAIHQAKVIHKNADTIVSHLKSFDWLGLGLVSAIFGFALGNPWKKSLREERWRWLLIPTGSLCIWYLPVYAEDKRYCLPALPFLVATSFGFALGLSGLIPKTYRFSKALPVALVGLSFVIGNETVVRNAFDGSVSENRDYLAAKIVANKLKNTPLVGPVASVGTKQPTGLFLAYLLNVPWFGQKEVVRNAEEILASDAALVVLPRDTPTAKQLSDDPRFTSLDKTLFGCDATSKAFRYEVFAAKPRTSHEMCPANDQ
jgi:hypothetical protein